MVTRREWLSGSLAFFFARFGVGCSSEDSPKNGAAPPGGASQFEHWQALRDALAQSPDHLRARADALVAAKDPKLIFEFVRDSIATVPPIGQAESLETAVRFGADNALRSGSGTPRERAELLVSLLDRAGFKASVVKGDSAGPLFANDAPAKVYLRRIRLAFEPAAPPNGGSWGDTAAAGAPDPVVVDAAGADSSALFVAAQSWRSVVRSTRPAS